MEIRLVVRATDATLQWTADEWTLLVVFAALSAEPETVHELGQAMRRYLPEHALLETGERVETLSHASETNGEWCVIDLVGRTAVVNDGMELPDQGGAYQTELEEGAIGFPIVWLDTPDDWCFRTATDGWERDVARRYVTALKIPKVDKRDVLYGTPCMRFIAESVLRMAPECQGECERRRDEEDMLEPTFTRRIHAQWLMTIRDDLAGRTPRQVLLADRKRIQLDLEHRAEQWTRQAEAPVSLSEDSMAYRYGGFGTAEVVIYFELLRALINTAWQQVGAPQTPTLAELVKQLEAYCDGWWRDPNSGFEGPRSPMELVQLERLRVPFLDTHEDHDDDCPICMAQRAGAFGPSFMWFDGHHLELEDDFAFSLADSYEAWESDRGLYDWEESDPGTGNREIGGGELLMVSAGDPECEVRGTEGQIGDGPESAWQSGLGGWDRMVKPGVPSKLAAMALGFPFTELSHQLRDVSGAERERKELNDAYVALCKSTGRKEVARVARRIRRVLEEIAGLQPDLTAKSADLQSRLDEVVRNVSSEWEG